ncbi:MAG: DUF6516 family protein [Proteobacteria bacterium]|nr:DUF6516 family protein [Pseudomonadota bacterium]
MKASLISHEKRFVVGKDGSIAIVEIKVWKISETIHYPDGLKFSLFLVKAEGGAVLGIDNHKPKGPHIHRGRSEMPYPFVSVDKLLVDFWRLVREEGYQS